MNFLQKARKVLALLMLTAFLAFFIRFDSFGQTQLSETLVRFQFLPALLAQPLFWTTIFFVFFLTLLTGRIYCSLLCPFGLIQDVLARLSRRKKTGYAFQKSQPVLHFAFAFAVIGAALGGFITLLAISEPFALAGRTLANVFQPACAELSRFLSSHLDGVNWFNKAKINPIETETLVVGIAFLAGILLVVRKWGRIFCNTLCPTGAILRLISGFSFFGLVMSKEKCTSCGLCEKSCKSGCIEVEKKELDFSRCVVCLNCLSACRFAAIGFKRREKIEKPFSQGRRALVGGALSATIAGIFPLILKNEARASNSILPPGAGNGQRFASNCISCHLCLTACPSSVIITNKTGFLSGSLLQPKLNFDRGMCEQTCNTCTKVCPTGALQPVSLEEKKTLKIAEVEYYKSLCVVETEGKDCGACAEHCPTKAVRMVSYKNNLMIPDITPDICVGCGSCEHICPVRPEKAIIVKPIQEQKHIKLPEQEPIKESDSKDEFPF